MRHSLLSATMVGFSVLTCAYGEGLAPTTAGLVLAPHPLPPPGSVGPIAFEIRAPWMEGFLLVRFPEMFGTSMGLHFIDHEKPGEAALNGPDPYPDWVRDPASGTLSYACSLAEGVDFGGEARPAPEGVRLRFFVANRTDEALVGGAPQICVSLSQSPSLDLTRDLHTTYFHSGGRFVPMSEATPSASAKGRDPLVMVWVEGTPRPGVPLGGDFPPGADLWWYLDQAADIPLLARETVDGRHLAAVSFPGTTGFLLHNSLSPCIHAGPTLPETILPGDTQWWEGQVFLMEKDFNHLLQAYERLAVEVARQSLPSRQSGNPTLAFAVDDFGADPTGATDSSEAVRGALATAIAAGPGARLVFGPGRYRLADSGRHHAALPVENAVDLVIAGAPGNGTELVLTDPGIGGVLLLNCTRVAVEDLVIDHDPVPFTQGRIAVVDREAGYFELELQAGYPSLAEEWFGQVPRPYGCWGMVFEPDERRIKLGAADFLFMDRWEPVDGTRWRLYPVDDQRQRLQDMTAGDRFVQMARFGRGGAVFFLQSRDCALRRVTVYASQSMATGGVAAEGIEIDSLQVRFRPGTDRLLTTNSDGMHFQQQLRGPRIHNCLLEGMADDAVNLYFYPNTIADVVNDREWRLTPGGQMAPGDRVQVFDPRRGRVVGETRIESASPQPDGGWIVVTDRPVDGITAGEPPSAGDSVYNLSRCARGFEIRDCWFRNHRRHGMMIKAPGGLIQGNRLEGQGGLGIVLGNDPEWPEGVCPHDVVVRDNVIRGTGRSRYYAEDPRGAAIQIKTAATGGRLAEERVTGRITLSGNRIVDPPGAAVYAGSAADVTLVDTRVEIGPAARCLRPCAAVILENVEGVRITGLDLHADSPSTTAALAVDGTSRPGELGVRFEEMRVFGTAEPTVIKDERESSHAGSE